MMLKCKFECNCKNRCQTPPTMKYIMCKQSNRMNNALLHLLRALLPQTRIRTWARLFSHVSAIRFTCIHDSMSRFWPYLLTHVLVQFGWCLCDCSSRSQAIWANLHSQILLLNVVGQPFQIFNFGKRGQIMYIVDLFVCQNCHIWLRFAVKRQRFMPMSVLGDTLKDRRKENNRPITKKTPQLFEWVVNGTFNDGREEIHWSVTTRFLFFHLSVPSACLALVSKSEKKWHMELLYILSWQQTDICWNI